MNWFDALTAILCLLLGLGGLRRGLIRETISFASTFISLFGAAKLYNPLYHRFFEESFKSTPIVGIALSFLIAFILIKFLTAIITSVIETIFEALHLGPLNKIGGMVVGVVKGLTISSFILILVSTFVPGSVETSKILPFVRWYIDFLRKLTGNLGG